MPPPDLPPLPAPRGGEWQRILQRPATWSYEDLILRWAEDEAALSRQRVGAEVLARAGVAAPAVVDHGSHDDGHWQVTRAPDGEWVAEVWQGADASGQRDVVATLARAADAVAAVAVEPDGALAGGLDQVPFTPAASAHAAEMASQALAHHGGGAARLSRWLREWDQETGRDETTCLVVGLLHPKALLLKGGELAVADLAWSRSGAPGDELCHLWQWEQMGPGRRATPGLGELLRERAAHLFSRPRRQRARVQLAAEAAKHVLEEGPVRRWNAVLEELGGMRSPSLTWWLWD